MPVVVTTEIEGRFSGTAARAALPTWHWQHKLHGVTVDIVLTVKVGSSSEAIVLRQELTDSLARWLDRVLAGKHLNNVTGLDDPRLDLVAQWLYQQLEVLFPDLVSLRVSTPQDRGLSVHYTPTEGARPDRG